MSCRFKQRKDGCGKDCCKVTDGECQFEKSPYDEHCQILLAYIDLELPQPPKFAVAEKLDTK